MKAFKELKKRPLGKNPRYQKNWLATPHVTPLFCPKNVDFLIFMQFLGILTQSQMSQIMARDEEKVFHIFNSSIQLGLIKPKGNSSEKFYLFGTLGKVGEVGPKYPQI